MSTKQQQIIDNQEQILRNQELALNNEGFWEHFTDHLIIAFSFFSLGFLVCTYFIMILYRKRVRMDYDIEEGTIMRVERKGGKRLLVIRPANLMQFYDIILLSFFDRGNGKFIFKQDTKRIRFIRNVLIIFTAMLIWSGIALILSAAEMDMNILNYLFK